MLFMLTPKAFTNNIVRNVLKIIPVFINRDNEILLFLLLSQNMSFRRTYSYKSISCKKGRRNGRFI